MLYGFWKTASLFWPVAHFAKRKKRLTGRRIIGGPHVDGFDGGGQRAAALHLRCLAGGYPFRVVAEQVESGLGSCRGRVREEIIEGVVGALVGLGGGPVSFVDHAVAGEAVDGEASEAFEQVAEVVGGAVVDAHFPEAAVEAGGVVVGREVGRFEENALDFFNDFAVHFALLHDPLPGGIGHERRPRSFPCRPVGVREHVIELFVGVVDGRPVADIGHAMLFEELGGVVSEAAVEVVQLAGVAVVNPQLVAAGVGGRNRLTLEEIGEKQR